MCVCVQNYGRENDGAVIRLGLRRADRSANSELVPIFRAVFLGHSPSVWLLKNSSGCGSTDRRQKMTLAKKITGA